MPVTKQQLLLVALTEDISPSSDKFYDNCVQWLKAAFPNEPEEVIMKYATYFTKSVHKKWISVRKNRTHLLVRQSVRIKKFFSEPIVIGQDLATSESDIFDVETRQQQIVQQRPDKSTACETCGNKPGDEVKKYLREMKRLESSLTGSEDPLRISFEDKVLESFKSKSYDNAAFVFQKLLEDPIIVGAKLAAVLKDEN